MKALLPKSDILKNWESIKDAIGWAKLPEDLLLKIANQLGEEEVPSMEVLAAVEVDVVKHAMRALNVTALKRTRVNLFMNALRLKYDLPLLDYTKVPADADKQQAEKRNIDVDMIDAMLRANQAKALAGPSVTVAHVLDQASSEQLVPLPADEVDNLRQALHDKLDGEPLEGETFTDSQLTAFKKRLDAGGSPACDYSVLGPYGNRLERKMKFNAVIRDSAGHERTVEVAGPDSLDTWEFSGI